MKASLRNGRRMRQCAIWRIERELEVVKAQLWGPQHDAAAVACKNLSAWRAEISGWSDKKCAAVVMQLTRQFRTTVIQEALQGEEEFLNAIHAAFGNGKVSRAA